MEQNIEIQKKLPKHIAFIMDGNGRWAKMRGKPRLFGHRAGYNALDKLISIAFDRGIEYLTFYAFSTENWSRPKDEVTGLMALLRKGLRMSAPKLVKGEIRLLVSGDTSVLNEKVKLELDTLLDKTKDFKGKTLNICFNYGGRNEIVHAVNEIIKEGIEVVDEKTISNHLYTAMLPDPDLIVRTSGEQRLSNFLLWQSAYSEFYYTDTLWPDFDASELEKAISWYQGRDRRFGNAK